MGNYNKFDKLEMLGDIDEKYIKEAEKYLEQPFATDNGVIRLAPQAKKFSWKSFAALAACAALVVGGTAFLANYLGKRQAAPPVYSNGSSDNSGNSESSNTSNSIVITDPYLEEFRKQYNVRDDIKISYLKDGWEWEKFEVDGYKDGLDGNSIERYMQYNAAFLGNKAILSVRTLDDGSKEIAAYDLADKTFTTLFGAKDEPMSVPFGAEMTYSLNYSDDNIVVFGAYVYKDGKYSGAEMRVLNVLDRSWFTVPVSVTETLQRSDMIIEDHILYFILCDPQVDNALTNFNGTLYSYDLSLKGKGTAERVALDAYRVFSCKDEIFYSTLVSQTDPDGINGTEIFYVPGGGEYSMPPAERRRICVVKNAGVFDNNNDTLTDLATGETLFALPEDAIVDALSDSCITFGNMRADMPDYFIFDAKNNELFLFKDSGLDVNSTDWAWYKCGESFCVFRNGYNNESEGYIIKRKTDNTENISLKNKRLTDIIEKYAIDIPTVGYMEDVFDLEQYYLPETIEGKYACYSDKGVIDGERIIAELYNSNSHALEGFGIYDFKAKHFEPIYQSEGYSSLLFANKDYAVFTEYKNTAADDRVYMMNIIDLSTGVLRTICEGKASDELDPSSVTNMVLLDGLLYFDSSRGNDWRVTSSIYCYDIKRRELQFAEEGKEPKVFKDTIVYTSEMGDTSATRIAALDGSFEFFSGTGGFWITENDIFIVSDDLKSVTNAFTNDVFFGGAEFLYMTAGGRFMSFCDRRDDNNTSFVYDSKGSRLLVYDTENAETACTRWLDSTTGVSFFYRINDADIETPYLINVYTKK